ncbi:hypothetical protein [Clostridium sporogenes]|uniref:hypothetical protein n=1 Tax=Clostridium sporogenes TaxID=1509 RepID=UPI0013D5F56F|nr:hypothetical protein [Clostridium sporogenes]NFH40739.1 hypothetical protein [Clostridium sporogenes]
MNQKKERVLKTDIDNFLTYLEKLDFTYRVRTLSSDWNGHILTSVVERYATRLYTHYEDWTTINNDLKYLEMIKTDIYNYLKDDSLHENLKQFIQEQKELDKMMYYTHTLLSYARVI